MIDKMNNKNDVSNSNNTNNANGVNNVIDELNDKINMLQNDNYFLREDNEKIADMYKKEKEKNEKLKKSLDSEINRVKPLKNIKGMNDIINNIDKTNYINSMDNTKDVKMLKDTIKYMSKLYGILADENKELRKDIDWFKGLVEVLVNKK